MAACDSGLTSFAGTSVLLKPGVITGGEVTHDCPLSRSIGYFLEPLVAIAPFAKTRVHMTLKGITTDDKDLSVRLPYTLELATNHRLHLHTRLI